MISEQIGDSGLGINYQLWGSERGESFFFDYTDRRGTRFNISREQARDLRDWLDRKLDRKLDRT